MLREQRLQTLLPQAVRIRRCQTACVFCQDGRPVGLQLLAPFGADAAVLRAAAALEARLALPKGTTPRPGTGKLNTEGPRTEMEGSWGS